MQAKRLWTAVLREFNDCKFLIIAHDLQFVRDLKGWDFEVLLVCSCRRLDARTSEAKSDAGDDWSTSVSGRAAAPASAFDMEWSLYPLDLHNAPSDLSTAVQALFSTEPVIFVEVSDHVVARSIMLRLQGVRDQGLHALLFPGCTIKSCAAIRDVLKWLQAVRDLASEAFTHSYYGLLDAQDNSGSPFLIKRSKHFGILQEGTTRSFASSYEASRMCCSRLKYSSLLIRKRS